MGNNPARQGRFELFYRAGWAYLTVYPRGPQDRELYPEDVENRMKLLGIPQVSARLVRECLDEASGEAVALTEWPAGKALAATMETRLDEEAMTAYLTVHAPKKGAAPPVLEDALLELERAGVRYGIITGELAEAMAARRYEREIPVARGKAPIQGRGRRVSYRFNVNRGKPYLEMDFGRINLRELNFIENVKAGDLLAELAPAVSPENGFTVTGMPIEAKAEPENERLQPGANTELSPEGDRLFATIEGNVRLTGERVAVEAVVVVKNVDYSTGNIRFDGSVVVEGSVADGFSVEAGGDIQVSSGVGRAQLVAGGSVLLRTGMNGSGKGSVRCGGDLFAKYLESCEVEAEGSVLVDEAIMHSRVRAGLHCALGGRRAELMSSEVIAGGSLWCKKLGHYNGADTRVFLGVLPRVVLEYRSALETQERLQKDLDKAEEQLIQVQKLLETNSGDARFGTAKEELQRRIASLGAELSALRQRAPGLRERVAAARNSMAVVEDSMYSGSVVAFGNTEYRTGQAGIRKLVLRCRDGILQESAFNYRDRPELSFGQ